MAGPACGAPGRSQWNMTACPLARSRNALLSEADRAKALSMSQSLRVRASRGLPLCGRAWRRAAARWHGLVASVSAWWPLCRLCMMARWGGMCCHT